METFLLYDTFHTKQLRQFPPQLFYNLIITSYLPFPFHTLDKTKMTPKTSPLLPPPLTSPHIFSQSVQQNIAQFLYDLTLSFQISSLFVLLHHNRSFQSLYKSHFPLISQKDEYMDFYFFHLYKLPQHYLKDFHLSSKEDAMSYSRMISHFPFTFR